MVKGAVTGKWRSPVASFSGGEAAAENAVPGNSAGSQNYPHISSPPHAVGESGKPLPSAPPPRWSRMPLAAAQLPGGSRLTETSGCCSNQPSGSSSTSCAHCTTERINASTSCFMVRLHASTTCTPMKLITSTFCAPRAPERVDASVSCVEDLSGREMV